MSKNFNNPRSTLKAYFLTDSDRITFVHRLNRSFEKSAARYAISLGGCGSRDLGCLPRPASC